MAPPTPELEWPEPIQRVQELAESGVKSLPPRYIRPLQHAAQAQEEEPPPPPPPVVDLLALFGEEAADAMQVMSSACREWGVFQVVNHGISHELLASAMAVSRSFFALPMEEKLKYANDPVTYVGYGSRLGVEKGITLDWSDYFFHLLRPCSSGNQHLKWPHQPSQYREIIHEYGERVFGLCTTLLSVFTRDLGLTEGSLLESFGGVDGLGAGFRMNYYPKCPQPQLTLGLSSHTDPGCFTLILQDEVSGLQVNKAGVWVSVPPIKDAMVVVIADQLEIISNGIYNSVNHRTVVNEERERMSLVVFLNPDGHMKIGPNEVLVGRSRGLRLYNDMTFNEYRNFIRTKGVQGRSILAARRTTCDHRGPHQQQQEDENEEEGSTEAAASEKEWDGNKEPRR